MIKACNVIIKSKKLNNDLLAVAKKYLRPDNLNIIVVGNEEVAEKLSVFDTNGGTKFRRFCG